MDFSQSEVWLGNVGKVSRKLRRNLTQNPWVLTSLYNGWHYLILWARWCNPNTSQECNLHLSYHLLCFCAKPLAADDIRAGWSFVKTGIGSWWIMFLIKNHISNQMSSNFCLHFQVVYDHISMNHYIYIIDNTSLYWYFSRGKELRTWKNLRTLKPEMSVIQGFLIGKGENWHDFVGLLGGSSHLVPSGKLT